MLNAASAGRLRLAGLLGIAAVTAIAVLQVALLLMLSFRSANQGRHIDQSGERRDLVWRMLYDAQEPERATLLREDAATLTALQAQFGDLSGTPYAALLADYLRAPDATGAERLSDVFNRLTAQYADEERRERQVFRTAAIAGGAVIVVLCIGLYVLVLRPTESAWIALVRRSEERRERFAAIFEENIDMMALYDPEGHIQRGNPTAVRRLGFTREDVGRLWTRHVAEREWTHVAGQFLQAAEGHATEFETVFRTASEEEVEVLTTLVPIRIGSDIVGVIGLAKDLTEKRAAERALAITNERFRAMFENHPDGIVEISADGRIVRANAPLLALSGYSEQALVGENAAMLAPSYDEFSGVGFAAMLAGDEAQSLRATLRRASGETVAVLLETIPIDAGEGAYVVVRDISKQAALEFKERVQRERLASVSALISAHGRDVFEQIQRTLEFAMNSLGMQSAAVGSVDGETFTVLHAVGGAFAPGEKRQTENTFSRRVYPSPDVLSIDDTMAGPWRDDPATSAQGWRSFIGATIFVDLVPYGTLTFASRKARVTSFDRADGDFVKVVAALVGAALARLRAEAALAEQAHLDPLTRLPNRSFFAEQLSKALARAERDGSADAVLFIDLDGFKAVNDAHGHHVGDDVLRAVATRCSSVLREGDLLARIGGDEFVVLQEACQGDDAALQLAARLIEAVAEPIVIAGTSLRLGASIGIALYPRDARSPADLISSADRAMYAAKRQGRGAALFHTL